MTGADIRQQFLSFFESKGHTMLQSSSLVPRNDPTVLLTTAGMQQMIPFFLGRETPPATRLTSVQKCFRTTDIDEVGDEHHLTFFEMMGNFSVGDYFKREAISWAWELLTEVMGLPPQRLHPTVHPADEEAPAIWEEITGKQRETITQLEDNWWGPPGASGPCGPDSEIYYDRGPQHGCGRADCAPGCECERFLEIWNLVFMQFYQDADGTRTPLPKQNIDTGFGLERIALVVQNKESVFDTDLFRPIIDIFAALAGVSYGQNQQIDTSLRVIADHARALVFLAADGVLPGNEGRGYIFRRVLRRAIRHGKLLGLEKPFLAEAADTVINLFKSHYAELAHQRDRIIEILSFEEKKFSQTLSAGLSLLTTLLDELEARGEQVIPGEQAFKLYDTHGFPLELTQEVARERGVSVDIPAFTRAMERQQERSRSLNVFVQGKDDQALDALLKRVGPGSFSGYQGLSGSGQILGLISEGQDQEMISAPQSALLVLDSTPFYAESGGQIGDRGEIQSPLGLFQVQDTRRPVRGLIVHYGMITEGYLRVGDRVDATVSAQRREDTMRNHSATHLLHKALRDLIGTLVEQRGSLVEPERLRFDFTCPRPLSAEELAQIDEQVNRWIRQADPVNTRILPLKEALGTGAMALFGEKYDEQVRVVTMGGSIELCGGTHCASTGQIGLYVTVQESSIAAGIRRIEALTGRAAEAYLRQRSAAIDLVSSKLQTQPDLLEQRVDQVLLDLAAARRQLARLQREKAQQQTASLALRAREIAGIAVVASSVDAPDEKVIREMGDLVLQALGRPGVVVLAGVLDERVSLQVSVSPQLTGRGLHAGKIAGAVGQKLGGKGGGRPESAQGGGKDRSQLGAALDLVAQCVQEQVR